GDSRPRMRNDVIEKLHFGLLAHDGASPSSGRIGMPPCFIGAFGPSQADDVAVEGSVFGAGLLMRHASEATELLVAREKGVCNGAEEPVAVGTGKVLRLDRA